MGNVEHALAHAEDGWPVLPVWWTDADGTCACGSTECKPGKHPVTRPGGVPRGKDDASTDPDVIRAWWARWPQANIGGRCDGRVVLDYDGAAHGLDAADLLRLRADHGATRCHVTQSGGVHMVWRKPPGAVVTNRVGRLRQVYGPAWDVRADTEGYVLLPGSSIAGRPYVRLTDLTVDEALLPAGLLELLTAAPDRPAAPPVDWVPAAPREMPGWLAERMTHVPTKESRRRSEHFLAIVGGLKDAGYDEDAARAHAAEWGRAAGDKYAGDRFDYLFDRAWAATTYRPPASARADAQWATWEDDVRRAQVAEEIDADEDPGGDEGEELAWVDLSWLLEGGPPETDPPAWTRRSDGHALFYAARINGVFGDPETAKSWLAMTAVAEALAAGRRAVYLDADHNGATTVAQRLVGLGVDPRVLADPGRFRLYEPADRADLAAWVGRMLTWRPAVAVVDSIGEIVPMLGLKSTDNDDITVTIRRVLKPVAHEADACVIGVDHLPKNAESRQSGYAIGGTAKKRAVDGSYLSVEAVTPPAPGKVGRLRLTIEKDRTGRLREVSPGVSGGDFVLDSRGTGTTWRVEATPMTDAGKVKPTYVMEQVSRHLEASDEPQSQRAVHKAVGESKSVRVALEELVRDRYAQSQPGRGGHPAYTSTRPYRVPSPEVEEWAAAARLRTADGLRTTADGRSREGAATDCGPADDALRASAVRSPASGGRPRSAEARTADRLCIVCGTPLSAALEGDAHILCAEDGPPETTTPGDRWGLWPG